MQTMLNNSIQVFSGANGRASWMPERSRGRRLRRQTQKQIQVCLFDNLVFFYEVGVLSGNNCSSCINSGTKLHGLNMGAPTGVQCLRRPPDGWMFRSLLVYTHEVFLSCLACLKSYNFTCFHAVVSNDEIHYLVSSFFMRWNALFCVQLFYAMKCMVFLGNSTFSLYGVR
jgi:hypothetical protein